MDELKKAVFANATLEELAELLAGKSDEEIAEFERLLAEHGAATGDKPVDAEAETDDDHHSAPSAAKPKKRKP
jgi:hypothetical protein